MSEEQTTEPQQWAEGQDNSQEKQEEETKVPQSGDWNNMDTGEMNPKLKFEFGEEYKITFPNDFEAPKERTNNDDNGVFYIFDVIYNGENRAIITSAWSLLRGFKMHEPLAGKTLKIKKTMKDGKQNYQVSE